MESRETQATGLDQPPRSGETSLAWSAASYAFVGVFFVLCASYVYANRGDFAFVATASLPELAIGSVLILAAFLMSAYQFALFLEGFGLRLGWVQLVALTMGMCLGNLVTPMRGGTGLLAAYMKTVHRLDFPSFAVIYGGTGLLIALINSGLALAALVLMWGLYGFFHPALAVATVGLFLVCLYLSVFPPPSRAARGGVMGMIGRAVNSWHVLTRDRGLLMRLALSFLAVAMLVAAAFFFTYRAIGANVSPLGALTVSSMGNIANLAALTPGSLGIFDAVVIQIPQYFGLDPDRSIAAALIFRGLSFFWALLLGIPGLVYTVVLVRRLR